MIRRWRAVSLSAVFAVTSMAAVTACTNSKSNSDPVTVVSAPDPNDSLTPDTVAVTVPETVPVEPVTEPSTTAETTTSSSTSTTTTSTTLPGRGLVSFLQDGSAVPPLALNTAQAIYAAIGSANDTALRELIIKGELRATVVGPGKGDLVTRMRAEAASGVGTPMADIRRLLEAPAATIADGSVVWPGVAVKDPATWDSADEEVLAALGFSPEAIAATKAKGKYVDERMVISAEGVWTGFLVGN